MVELIAARDAARRAVIQGRTARAQRPRTLSLADDAYVGEYFSPTLGTMYVRQTPSGLEVSIGLQHARAENFTRPESIRVELTPLSGEPIIFQLDAAGRPSALTYARQEFRRR